MANTIEQFTAPGKYYIDLAMEGLNKPIKTLNIQKEFKKDYINHKEIKYKSMQNK